MQRLNIDESIEAGRGAAWRYRAMKRLAETPADDQGANDALRIFRRLSNDFTRHYSPMLAPYTTGMARGMAESGSVSLPLAAAQAAIALGLASGVASLMAWAQGLIGGVL